MPEPRRTPKHSAAAIEANQKMKNIQFDVAGVCGLFFPNVRKVPRTPR